VALVAFTLPDGMSATPRDRVLGVIAAVLRIPASTLDERSSPDDVSAWDSLQHLQIILALEEEFGVRFQPEEIDHLQTAGGLIAAVSERMK
jgi:acyl carrier protein